MRLVSINWYCLWSVYLCVSVCPPPMLVITSGVMWHDMDPIWLVKQVLQLTLKLDNSVLNIIVLDSHHAEWAFNMFSEWLRRDTTSCYCKLISAMKEQGLDSGVIVLKEKIKSSKRSWVTRINLLETHLIRAYYIILLFTLYSYVIVPEKITLIRMFIMTTLLLISKLHNFHDIS